jgi:hypothetical protein
MMYEIMAHPKVHAIQTDQCVTELLVRWSLPFMIRRKMYLAGSWVLSVHITDLDEYTYVQVDSNGDI